MDHIAHVTGKDPVQVRLANLSKNDSQDIPPMLNDVMESANYRQRVADIEKFNKVRRR